MAQSTTPLAELLRECEPEQRERLAALAGESVNYLYQIAGCHRRNTSAAKALAIEDASRTLHRETGGATRVVTVRELAAMCDCIGLDA